MLLRAFWNLIVARTPRGVGAAVGILVVLALAGWIGGHLARRLARAVS
jgi:hypothetical protein